MQHDNNTPREGGVTGKGFVKGDPRINRKGRPKSSDEFRSFLLTLLHEAAYTSDGKPVVIDGKHATNLEVVSRRMIGSKDFRQVEKALAYAFGLPKTTVELGGLNGEPLTLMIVERIVDAESAANPNG